MENFKKLNVWLKAHKLVLDVYNITEKFLKSELFCLTSQMRRAAISVVANIVEGTKRKTIKDRVHFLTMSETSLEEVKYYFLLSYELKYIGRETGEVLTEKAREVGRMLTGLSKSLDK
jgi:four helix bundle protein